MDLKTNLKESPITKTQSNNGVIKKSVMTTVKLSDNKEHKFHSNRELQRYLKKHNLTVLK